MPNHKQNNKKKPRAIFHAYGSQFLHRLSDLQKRLEKTTELTRKKLIFIFVCCICLSSMTKSLFRFERFTPFTLLINGLFSFSGLLMTCVLFLLVVLGIYIMYRYNNKPQNEYDEERNLTRSAYGTHGTAKFIEGDEIKEVYGLHHPDDLESINGFVIGKVPNIPQNMGYIGDVITRDEELMAKKFKSNRNVVILGSPGTGKSATIMIQNLIESAKRGESVFVTDPKGELCDNCSPIFRELGYDVKVFNLIYPWHSNKWNFMEWLSSLGEEREKWIGTIGKMIITNTSGDKADTFWESTAERLLTALISLLIEIASPKARLKDSKLDEFSETIKDLRRRRDKCETIIEQNELNAEIEQVIRKKYDYMNERLNYLKAKIEECNVPAEKKRLKELQRKLVAFRNDERLLPLLDKSNPPEDYEPITISEAKKRILNVGTIVKILKLRIFVTKEEQAAFKTWNAIPLDQKMTRLLYELAFKTPAEQRQFKTIYQVFSLCDPNHSLAYSYWCTFTESSEAVCTSAKGGLDTRLSAFNQHYIKQMTSENEIDLEKPGREKCAYFCIISAQETSMAYVSSLFITIAMETLWAQADAMPNGRLSRRVMFYLDEFANIGVVPDMTKKLSTYRSADIHIIMAIQNLPQIWQRYDENMCLEMFGDCDLMLFLGCGNEDKTPEFISKLMGKMTTSTRVRRRSGNIFIPIQEFDYSETEQHSQRDLMFLSEIRGLDGDRLLVLTSGQRPIQVDKYYHFHRPDYEWIKETIKKYPVISGNPLPREEAIDMDALFNDSPVITDTSAQEQPKATEAEKQVNAIDAAADEANKQMEYQNLHQQLQEMREKDPAAYYALVGYSKDAGEEKATPTEKQTAESKITPTQTQDAPCDKSDAVADDFSAKDYTAAFDKISDGFVDVEKMIAEQNEAADGEKKKTAVPKKPKKYEVPQKTRKLQMSETDLKDV